MPNIKLVKKKGGLMIKANSVIPSTSNIDINYPYSSTTYPLHFTVYKDSTRVGLIKQLSSNKWKLLSGCCPLNASLVYTDDDDIYGETLVNYIKRDEHIKDFGTPDKLISIQDLNMSKEINSEKPIDIKWSEHIDAAFKSGVKVIKYCKSNGISRSQLYKYRADSLKACKACETL